MRVSSFLVPLLGTAWLAGVAAAIVAVVAVASGVRPVLERRRQARAPETVPPIIVADAVGYSYSAEPLNERRMGGARLLIRIEIAYGIENKEGGQTVVDVLTGMRRRDDGREYEDGGFRRVALAPRENVRARYELPTEFFEGFVEHDLKEAFLVWARYSSVAGERFEELYDPVSGEHVRRLLALN